MGTSDNTSVTTACIKWSKRSVSWTHPSAASTSKQKRLIKKKSIISALLEENDALNAQSGGAAAHPVHLCTNVVGATHTQLPPNSLYSVYTVTLTRLHLHLHYPCQNGLTKLAVSHSRSSLRQHVDGCSRSSSATQAPQLQQLLSMHKSLMRAMHCSASKSMRC